MFSIKNKNLKSFFKKKNRAYSHVCVALLYEEWGLHLSFSNKISELTNICILINSKNSAYSLFLRLDIKL